MWNKRPDEELPKPLTPAAAVGAPARVTPNPMEVKKETPMFTTPTGKTEGNGAAVIGKAVKIVGVSDDHDKVQRCEAEAQTSFGGRATAARSQPYYLDITNKDANKGAVAEYLARRLKVPIEEIATIGDQPNDVLMFKRSGFSIAMGNASDEVKKQADATTDSYNDEGFAKAMERFILGEPG